VIGLILPSRGLIHSRTAEALFKAVSGVDVKLYWSHDRPIPDCFNMPIRQALDDGCSHIWIVEEDVVIPEDAVERLLGPLLRGEADLTFCDYWCNNGDVTTSVSGVTVTGTGCVMIPARIMEEFFPFRSWQTYTFPDLKPLFKYSEAQARKHLYGKHDIDFWIRAQNAGYRPLQVGRARHCKVQEYGKSGTNSGFHNITVYE
jgi:hypothetical protein